MKALRSRYSNCVTSTQLMLVSSQLMCLIGFNNPSLDCRSRDCGGNNVPVESTLLSNSVIYKKLMFVSSQLMCLIGFTNPSLNCTLHDGGGYNVPDENIALLKAIGTTTVICTGCYVCNISADVPHIFILRCTYGWIKPNLSK